MDNIKRDKAFRKFTKSANQSWHFIVFRAHSSPESCLKCLKSENCPAMNCKCCCLVPFNSEIVGQGGVMFMSFHIIVIDKILHFPMPVKYLYLKSVCVRDKEYNDLTRPPGYGGENKLYTWHGISPQCVTSDAKLRECLLKTGEAIKLVWLGQTGSCCYRSFPWQMAALTALKMDWVSCTWSLNSGVRSHNCGHVFNIFTEMTSQRFPEFPKWMFGLLGVFYILQNMGTSNGVMVWVWPWNCFDLWLIKLASH